MDLVTLNAGVQQLISHFKSSRNHLDSKHKHISRSELKVAQDRPTLNPEGKARLFQILPQGIQLREKRS